LSAKLLIPLLAWVVYSRCGMLEDNQCRCGFCVEQELQELETLALLDEIRGRSRELNEQLQGKRVQRVATEYDARW
jgi:hypothetical protein